jgi:hypothetical protein
MTNNKSIRAMQKQGNYRNYEGKADAKRGNNKNTLHE